MYFNILPSIKYDVKPVNYPFSESDYVVAKNFFRRYKISDTGFNYSVYYKKFAVQDGDRLEQIAEKLYGNPFYDWIIALTNNMISPLFGLPMSENELRIHVEKQYDNPYYDIHHYEIISDEKQMELFGKVILPGGTWVDETFYNNAAQYTANTFPNLTPDSETIPIRKDYVFTSDTDSNQFDNGLISYQYGTYFTEFGTGTGNDGGFTIYPPIKDNTRPKGYLRFRGVLDDARQAWFNPIDSTYYNKITLYGKFGTNINGGEWPDVKSTPTNKGENLRVYYRFQPGDPWIDMGTIIDIGVAQSVLFFPEYNPPTEYGDGGTGRPDGVYENLTVYNSSNTPTTLRVTVTVENHTITKVDFVDRGNNLDDSTAYHVKNEDLGNGYIIDPTLSQVFLPDFGFTVSVLHQYNDDGTINGAQYGRYDTIPFQFSLPIPPEARGSKVYFALWQPDNTGVAFDQYGISAVYFTGEITKEIPLGFDWVQIDSNNYVIDGEQWTKIDNIWYIKTEQGYKYWDGDHVEEVSGSILARPVTQFEYEQTENEKNREIYILKPQYVDSFIEEFRKAALYKKSSDFVSNRLKKTGV